MPYDTIQDAKDAGFPTTAEGTNLTLSQINKLAEIFDAVTAAGTAENPMAVAWTQWKQLYEIKEDKWVTIETANSYIGPTESTEIEYDTVITNNAGSKIKVREDYIYVGADESFDIENLKNKLAMDVAYQGLGSYEIYERNELLKVGDQLSIESTPLLTVTIAVSAKSSVLTSAVGNSVWIPVAVVGQETTTETQAGSATYTMAESALSGNLETWKGGYINVNHEGFAGDAAIDNMVIEDAKFEDGTLYHKVNQDVADFIYHNASSGRSIESNPVTISDNGIVTEITGLGLSVLFPPFEPACSVEMGCSSNKSNLISSTFKKLAEKVKLNSFMTNEVSGIHKPDVETQNMEEDIATLTSAKVAAEMSRDAALTEVTTLKSSLEEKDGLLAEQITTIEARDATIVEQVDELKVYKDAEVAAAEELKETQWTTIASSIPPGLTHKQEDADALKAEFMEDTAAFAVKLSSMKQETSTTEDGAMHSGTGGSTKSAFGTYDPKTKGWS